MPAPHDPPPNLDHRQRLAELVTARRRELGLSVRAAAAAAGIARGTWIALEEGNRRTTDSNYAGIERALHWAPDSITTILDGGAPTTKPASPPTQTYDPDDTRRVFLSHPGGDDEALVRVMRSDLPDAKKRQLVQLLIDERAEADRRRVEHAEQLIRLVAGDD